MSDLNQVQLLFDKGRLKEAMVQVNEIDTILSPEHPDFFNLKILNARILLELGKYEEGEKLLNNMLDFGRRGGLMVRIDMIILLSDILWRKGNWDQAFFMIEMGEYDFTKLGQSYSAEAKDLRYAELKRLKGIYYRYSGELDLAVEYFQESLVTAEHLGDKRLLAKIFNFLGQVTRETGELARSQLYYKRAYELYNELNDEIGMGNIQFYFGNLLEYTGDLSSAIQNYNKALYCSQRVANQRLRANTLSSLGILGLKMGDFREGIRMVNAGLTLKVDLGNDLDSALTFYQFITYLISTDQEALVPIYIDELEEIYARNKHNNLISQYYQLIQVAIMLTDTKSDLSEAKIILEDIIDAPVIDMQLAIHAMTTLCHLLFRELSHSPKSHLMKDIFEILSKLRRILVLDYSIPLDIQVSILQAKLHLLEGSLYEGLNLINACIAIIENMNLRYLERGAIEVYNKILEEIKLEKLEPPEEDSSDMINGEQHLIESNGSMFYITDKSMKVIIETPLTKAVSFDTDLKMYRQLVEMDNFDLLEYDEPINHFQLDNYSLITHQFADIVLLYFYQGQMNIAEIQKFKKLLSNLENIYNLSEIDMIENIDPILIKEILQ